MMVDKPKNIMISLPIEVFSAMNNKRAANRKRMPDVNAELYQKTPVNNITKAKMISIGVTNGFARAPMKKSMLPKIAEPMYPPIKMMDLEPPMVPV